MCIQLLRKHYIKILFLAFFGLLLLITTFNQQKTVERRKAAVNFKGNDYLSIKNAAQEGETFDWTESSEAQQPRRMFVNTSMCRIPYIEPFTPELLAIYKPQKYQSCSNEPDLITPIYDEKLKRYVMHINDTLAREILHINDEKYNCCFEKIIHSETDDSYLKYFGVPPKKYFKEGFVVPVHVEGMYVECHLAAKRDQKLHEDAFFLVQHKVPTTAKSTLRKPSVIMLGIDALSRINFRRTMPKVFEHLQMRGWHELQGYNKVADNTLPNLIALLTGYKLNSLNVICNISESGCLDQIPIIWKHFKSAGYLTAYAEDESQISTFNYLHPGFKTPPVDYYFRPFLKAIEENMAITYRSVRRYCIGRRVVSSYVFDFCRQYMQRFSDERPIFGLFWTNHFSHEDWQLPALMSDKILQYLLDFESDGAMETTIMIFFADHGFRSGNLVNLPEGFYEERLPTMFIWLPPWFRDQYPAYVSALQTNRNRLTSNFDLHMTLKHILKLGTSHDLSLSQAFDCPKCQSLFYPVPEDRTCADAGIIDHWCTCNPYTTVTSHKYARKIPYLVAERMNAYFEAKNLSKQCSKLKLRYLHTIELKQNLYKRGVHITQDVETYRTKFTVNPNGAEFEATVLFNNRTKAISVDVETISRLNRYHNDSLCINDKEAKKYCICFSSIKDEVQH